MRITRAAILSAVLWTAAVPAAQNPPQPPVFRGVTELVELDVVAHRQDGTFVADLSADDFVVEEGGRPQPIQQFYLHVTDGIGKGAGGLTLQATVGTTDTQAESPRVFVVVFDDDHLSPSGFKRTQAAAHALFSQQFRSGDVGGVIVGGRMAKDRLTTDREELLRAVKDAKPTTSRNSRVFDEQQWPRLTEIEAVRITFNSDRIVLDEAIRRACSDEPDMCKRVDPELPLRAKASQMAVAARSESAKTLRTLATLTTGLADMPGRKTILLMSEGFVAEDTWPLVSETVALAARANARIYTLDARGLERRLRTTTDAAPTGNDSSMRMLEQMDFGADSVNSLAVDSGGFVVRNTNQFDAAIARVADDAGNYYVLAIRPEGQPDGTFHPVKVKVKRAGVAVRARRGYVVMPRAPATETAAPPPERVNVPDASPAAAAAPTDAPVDTPREPEPSSVEAIGPRATTASSLRLRPDADAHARSLAGGSSAADADATAGWEAYQRGDVETARSRLAFAVSRPGATAWMFYTFGMAQYALRQYRDAAAAWERVRAAAPEFEPVYFDLVDAYLQLREHDQAIRTARGAIGRWPGDPELLNALGVVQTSRGALDDAVKSFQSAIATSPGEATAYFNLGKAMELRYFRTRRYVQQLGKWIANENDRSAAIENYQKYIDMGGAYAESARAGVTRLTWVPGK